MHARPNDTGPRFRGGDDGAWEAWYKHDETTLGPAFAGATGMEVVAPNKRATCIAVAPDKRATASADPELSVVPVQTYSS